MLRLKSTRSIKYFLKERKSPFSTQFTIDAEPSLGNPFHLAIPVHNLKLAREFYGDLLGLKEGRRDDNKWQDYSLYGHQIVCHYVGKIFNTTDLKRVNS